MILLKVLVTKLYSLQRKKKPKNLRQLIEYELEAE